MSEENEALLVQPTMDTHSEHLITALKATSHMGAGVPCPCLRVVIEIINRNQENNQNERCSWYEMDSMTRSVPANPNFLDE